MRELSKETSLQRVMRASGRVPVQCSCSVCKQQCHTPCLGTPDDIERIIDAGYADRLALTNWAAGIFLGVINIAIPMIQPVAGKEYCAFFENGLCILHDKGLKPTEGRLSHHTVRKDNIDTFMRVADACNQNHVKLIYASSSTANPENTTSMYGISKYFDEQYASIYCKAATGCRLHNVYGPNPRKRTLLWFLMEKENVSLYNCGQNIRCFTYIDDVIEGLIYSVGCNRQLINICNVQPVTTMYFASLVKYYKPLEIELINEKRDFDNLEQSVNQDIYLVPLSYTSVEDGVKKIFDERKGKDMSY